MKHLGYRKRGGAPMHYELVRDGLKRYLRIIDSGGTPVAVVEIEYETISEIHRTFL